MTESYPKSLLNGFDDLAGLVLAGLLLGKVAVPNRAYT